MEEDNEIKEQTLNILRDLNLTQIEFEKYNALLEQEKSKNKNKNNDNFKPDEALKDAFFNVEAKHLIAAMNEILKTKFQTDSKIKYIPTEFIGTTGDVNKRSIRGDLAFEIINPNNNEVTDTIAIEFQSTDTNMPFRMSVYAFNLSKEFKMKVKSEKDGKVKWRTKKVHVRPYKVIIYTSLMPKKAYGYKEHYVSFPDFKVNDVPHSAKDGDYITECTPFINFLYLELDEINNSGFDFLQGLYLYRFKKDMELIKTGQFIEAIKTIDKNISKFKGKTYIVALKLHLNLLKDIDYNMLKNIDEFLKEKNDMENMYKSFADRLEDAITERVTASVTQSVTESVTESVTQSVTEKVSAEYLEKGAEKGMVEVILNMFKHCTIEQIATFTNKTIDEIKQIQQQYSV